MSDRPDRPDVPEHGEYGGPLVRVVAVYEDGSERDVTKAVRDLEARPDDRKLREMLLEAWCRGAVGWTGNHPARESHERFADVDDLLADWRRDRKAGDAK